MDKKELNKILDRYRVRISANISPEIKNYIGPKEMDISINRTLINEFSGFTVNKLKPYISESVDHKGNEKRELDIMVIPTELFDAILRELKK